MDVDGAAARCTAQGVEQHACNRGGTCMALMRARSACRVRAGQAAGPSEWPMNVCCKYPRSRPAVKLRPSAAITTCGREGGLGRAAAAAARPGGRPR